MSRFPRLTLLTFAVCLAGCSAFTSPASPSLPSVQAPSPIPATVFESPPAVIPSATPTPLPSLTATIQPPTLTPTPPPATSTATSTATIPPAARLEIQCQAIAPTLPVGEQLKGVLVLAPIHTNSFQSYKKPAYLLDLVTGIKKELLRTESEISYRFAVSPRGQWLAYEKINWDEQGKPDKDRLVIADSGGIERAEIQLHTNEWRDPESTGANQEGWVGWLGYWLDDERLVIRQAQEGSMDTLRIVNPFTGKQQVLKPDRYPDILPWSDIEPLWGLLTIYDPSLRWVVYVALQNEHDYYLALWDRQAARMVAHIPNFLQYSIVEPQWSPDGTRFAYVASLDNQPGGKSQKNELYSADLQGQVTRLTYLTEYYAEVHIDEFSWSPDGRKLAFWMKTSEDLHHDYLAILDLDTQQVMQTCVRGNPFDTPDWSLDNLQILVNSRVEYYEPDQIVLLDLPRGFAATIISDELSLVGWMVKSH